MARGHGLGISSQYISSRAAKLRPRSDPSGEKPRLRARRASARKVAASAVEAEQGERTKNSILQNVSSVITTLFPLWTVITAGVGLQRPEAFAFMTTDRFTIGLAVLMFSMGITLSVEDFKRVFQRPGPVGIGFFLCYCLMPVLALGVSKMLNLPSAMAAGMILVGSINGGQASNLCTYIASGDVALSVIMTTSTTLGCTFMTPLLSKYLLGAIVPVDALGIAKSTLQVVLAPIAAGVSFNRFLPSIASGLSTFSPVIGVAATCALVGASVAQVNTDIVAAGKPLQVACALLHLIGGIAGYFALRLGKFSETTSRTAAIETAMKSSAFGFLLAKKHFSDYLVRVPSAVSVVWMALIGASLAVYWRFFPVSDGR